MSRHGGLHDKVADKIARQTSRNPHGITNAHLDKLDGNVAVMENFDTLLKVYINANRSNIENSDVNRSHAENMKAANETFAAIRRELDADDNKFNIMHNMPDMKTFLEKYKAGTLLTRQTNKSSTPRSSSPSPSSRQPTSPYRYQPPPSRHPTSPSSRRKHDPIHHHKYPLNNTCSEIENDTYYENDTLKRVTCKNGRRLDVIANVKQTRNYNFSRGGASRRRRISRRNRRVGVLFTRRRRVSNSSSRRHRHRHHTR